MPTFKDPVVCLVDGNKLRKDKFPYATTALKQIHKTDAGHLYYFADVNAKDVKANKTRIYLAGNACGAYAQSNKAAQAAGATNTKATGK